MSICWRIRFSTWWWMKILAQTRENCICDDAFRPRPGYQGISYTMTGVMYRVHYLSWCKVRSSWGRWKKKSLQCAVHAHSFPWSSRWSHQLLNFNCLSLHDPAQRCRVNKVEWCNFMRNPPCRNIKWRQDGVLVLRLDPAPWCYCIQQDKTSAHPNYF